MNAKGNYGDFDRLDAKDANLARVDLTSTFYGCLNFSYTQLVTDSSTGASKGLIIASTGKLSSTGGAGALFFDASVCEWARFSVYMPSNYKEATDVVAYLDWGTTSSTGSTQYVAWELQYTWNNIGSTASASASYSAISSSCTTDVLTMKTTNFATITGTAMNVNSLLNCSILRNSSGSTLAAGLDDYSADALLFGVRLYYQIDGMGSTAVNGDK